MFWRVLAAVFILFANFWLPQPKAEAYLWANSSAEEEAGHQFYQQIEGQSYYDPAIGKFFDRVRASMPEKSRAQQSVLRVLRSQEINAFCGPNGIFCVTEGAMKFFPAEELAGIMAHELGHSQKNHWGKLYESLVWTAAGVSRLANSGTVDRQTAGILNNVVQTAITRGYGFDNEYEADRYSFEVMKRSAEFNPMSIAMAFVRVSKMEVERGPKNQSFDNFSRPHPETENRILQQAKLLAEWTQNKVSIDAKTGDVIVGGKPFLAVGGDRSTGFRAAGLLGKIVVGGATAKASTIRMMETGNCMVYVNDQYIGVANEDQMNDFFKSYKIAIADITPPAPPLPENEEE